MVSGGGGWGSGKARAAMHVPIMSTTDIDSREGVNGIHLSPSVNINWEVGLKWSWEGEEI